MSYRLCCRPLGCKIDGSSSAYPGSSDLSQPIETKILQTFSLPCSVKAQNFICATDYNDDLYSSPNKYVAL